MQIVKPKHAPFFLPTAATLTGFEFDTTTATSARDAEKTLSRLVQRKLADMAQQSAWTRQLTTADDADARATALDALKSMSVAQIDAEIRQLPLRHNDTRVPTPCVSVFTCIRCA